MVGARLEEVLTYASEIFDSPVWTWASDPLPAAHGQDDDDVAEWFGFDMRKVASFEDRQELLPGVGFFHWCTNLAILNHPILWFILRLKKFYCPRVFVWMFAGGVDGQVHMVNTLSACLGSILPGMIP